MVLALGAVCNAADDDPETDFTDTNVVAMTHTKLRVEADSIRAQRNGGGEIGWCYRVYGWDPVAGVETAVRYVVDGEIRTRRRVEIFMPKSHMQTAWEAVTGETFVARFHNMLKKYAKQALPNRTYTPE
jgi:hypothetical protein